jgi:ornithine carrier protein
MLTREGALGATAAVLPTTTLPKSTPTPSPSSSSSRPFSTSSVLRQTPTPAPHTLAPPMGPLALISDTFRRQGLRGLWLGQTGTLLRETGGSAAWFGAYETSTRLFITSYKYTSKSDLAAWQLMLSGALAGVSYNVILFPADSIKSTMQTFAELNPGSKRSSFLETGKRIFRMRGVKGLYAGCGLTCLRSGPSSAMIFFLFQRLEQNFGYIFGLDGEEVSGKRSKVKVE